MARYRGLAQKLVQTAQGGAADGCLWMGARPALLRPGTTNECLGWTGTNDPAVKESYAGSFSAATRIAAQRLASASFAALVSITASCGITAPVSLENGLSTRAETAVTV